MKKLIWLTAFVVYLHSSRAQEVLRVQNGAVITIQNNAPVMVLGDVLLQNGSNLLNNGTITIKRYAAAGTGNWLDQTATGYFHGSGTLIFNSPATQSVNSKNLFARIEVNNNGLTLASDINSLNWHLVKGVITTNSFKAISLNSGANAITADATNTNFSNSYINGTLRQFVAPAVVNNYVFPVGNALGAHVAEMDNLTVNALNNVQFIDAFFAPKAGTDAGFSVVENSTLYTNMHDAGVWHLIPNIAPTVGRFDLRLYINGFTGLIDDRFTILRRSEGSVNGADWMVPAGSFVNANGGIGRTVAGGFALRRNLSGFSEFGIGVLNAPLPVTLVAFDARRTAVREVLLSWQTETEANNKGFAIELRRDNETVFTSRGFTASKAFGGNSQSPLSYSFTDENGYNGISYYRLKQIDIDDRSSYSLIRAVRGSNDATVSVVVAPNPSHGQFSVRTENTTGVKTAFVYDMHGKLVYKFNVQDRQPVYITHLAAGSYVLMIPDALGIGQHFKEMIMIVR